MDSGNQQRPKAWKRPYKELGLKSCCETCGFETNDLYRCDDSLSCHACLESIERRLRLKQADIEFGD